MFPFLSSTTFGYIHPATFRSPHFTRFPFSAHQNPPRPFISTAFHDSSYSILASDLHTMSMCVNHGSAFIMAITILFLTRMALAHGVLYGPPQRGATNGNKYSPVAKYDPTASVDHEAHFPAGSKSMTPGAGLKSQTHAAGPRGWTPYEPLSNGFLFRAGVCGDLLSGGDHLRGGKFYNGGKIFKTYRQEDIISIDVAVTTHHNGFFTFYVCDVSKCGGEIGVDCFKRGHCHRLQRAWDERCESRQDKGCAPIDPNYPWRWYLPCPSGKVSLYGKGKMLYKLPKNLECTHCVLQWYWVTANNCNPPGLLDYFNSNRAPDWGSCRGQGGAIGGWRRWETLCGGELFPEEYYQCADIEILPKGNKPRKPKKAANSKKLSEQRESSKRWTSDASKNKPTTDKREASMNQPKHRRPVWWGKNCGPLVKIVLLADGKPIADMYHGSTHSIDVKRYKHLTFRAVAFRKVKDGVGFYFNGRRWWTERKKPYIFGGDAGVWYDPWYNQDFRLAAVGEENWLVVNLTLKN